MDNTTETKGQHLRNEMLRKAKEKGIEFGINDGTKDGGLDIIDCDKRTILIDKNGRLLFKQENTPNIIWTLIMTFLGALVPSFMLFRGDLKLRVIALGIFTMFQIGAVATVNAGRPEIRVFDKERQKYRIRRANHIFTRIFRKTWIDVCDLKRISTVKLTSFKAKRWDMRWIGTGDNKYRHQELRQYENYRLYLRTFDGEKITFYDWYEMDHPMEIGEEIAKYLGVTFSLE